MRRVTLLFALIALIAACSAVPAASVAPEPVVKPAVAITSPPSNAQAVVGQPLPVQTAAVDSVGVARIDLIVDGTTVASAQAPTPGVLQFAATQTWVPTTVGTARVVAVAFRADGTASDPFPITIVVLAAGSTPAPYPTIDPSATPHFPTPYPTGAYQPTPTATPYASPTATRHATPTAHATLGPTPTATLGPTPTATSTTSPTATPTATPTTTASADPVASPDAQYAFVVPYNGSKELSDVVSWPNGDTSDVVKYDVSGLSASPPGNTAQLNVFLTCEGTGTQYLRVAVGQATYGCGSKILDRLVTSDSRTGTFTISFTGIGSSAYVRWTLAGNAAP